MVCSEGFILSGSGSENVEVATVTEEEERSPNVAKATTL
jgi:hypothetical protein